MIARMNDAKRWLIAFHMYAADHSGEPTTNFDQATNYVFQDFLSTTDHFEITYDGRLSAITNPASTIVVREIEAHPTPDGAWVRTYGFADGHTEVHQSADGDFTAWEQQHGVPAQ
jgi:hypothetical protein